MKRTKLCDDMVMNVYPIIEEQSSSNSQDEDPMAIINEVCETVCTDPNNCKLAQMFIER
ncbi:MAG: hypothetical protein LBG88_01560 [Christensenellaceae bacterium]|jgi:hypothetical protein|nr:hypothetical protein [Christensenellaceae bacterium]